MSYSNATFFLDAEGGSDSARADLVPTAYANNGSGLVRVTCNSTAAYATGAVMDVAGTTGSVYVGGWIVTVIDGTHVDLQGSSFTSNPATKGSLTPRGGSQKSDAWKTITAGPTSARTQAGDTIRVMGSPAVTSLGINGTWTDGPLGTTVNIVSSTNATPIVVTVGAGHGFVTGDTIIGNGHTTNTKANGVWKASVSGNAITLLNADGTNSVGNGVGGATGTLRRVTNCAVILASAVTKAIAVVGNQGTKGNWTADNANITCTVITTDFKEGGECQQIAVGASFTTGLAAHFATGTLDLSAYQQVTFWVKQTSGTVAVAGDAKLQLCTNTDGTGGVHDVAIPALLALNRWVPVTVDLATNLNSAIKSVNFTQLVDRGAQTFLVDCIAACKASSSADSLTLTSLIGKNSGTESWCAIQSINDVRVMLDGQTNSIPASSPQRGYSGVTETVTAYKRETIKTTMASASTNAVQTLQKDGSSGSLVSFEGGWDRTNMTSQNLETWFDGQNGLGQGIVFASRAFNSLNKISGVRYNDAFYLNNAATTGCVINNAHANNNTNNGVGNGNSSLATNGGVGNVLGTIVAANNNGNDGVFFRTANANSVVAITAANGNTFIGLDINTSSNQNTIGPIGAIRNNGSTGFQLSQASGNRAGVISDASGSVGDALSISSSGATTHSNYNVIQSITAAGGTVTLGSVGNIVLGGSCAILAPSSNTEQWNYLRNFTVTGSVTTPTAFFNARLYVEKYGGTAGDNRVFTDGGSIVSQTSVRHTASGIAWNIAPTSANRQANYPLDIPLAQIAVQANKAVTVKCFIRRDSTSITAQMLVKGGQLAGVASDVSVTASGSANAWQEESLTFTPTEAGVIEITGQAYGGTTLNAYFDDMTFQQGGRTQRATMDIAWRGQPFAPMGPAIAGSFFLTFP